MDTELYTYDGHAPDATAARSKAGHRDILSVVRLRPPAQSRAQQREGKLKIVKILGTYTRVHCSSTKTTERRKSGKSKKKIGKKEKSRKKKIGKTLRHDSRFFIPDFRSFF